MNKLLALISLTALLAACSPSSESNKPYKDGSIEKPALPPQTKTEAKKTAPLPRLATSCHINFPQGVRVPEIYFSEDCKTAFLAPLSGISGTYDILPYSPSTFCSDLAEQTKFALESQKRVEAYETRIAQLEKELLETSDESKRNTLLRHLNLLKEIRDQAAEDSQLPDLKRPTVSARFIISSENFPNIQDWEEANPNLEIILMEAPYSVIEISSKKQFEGSSAIARIDFPSFQEARPPFGVTKSDATYAFINGGLSGFVYMTAEAYCASSLSAEQIVSDYVSIKLLTKASARYKNGERFPIQLTDILK